MPNKYRNKYKINETYFETIDTESKAYFLGYLFADGCIRRTKANHLHGTSQELKFKIHNKDVSILKAFRKDMASNSKIRAEAKTNCSTIAIYNKKIVEDLISHGCVQNKTFKLRFPKNVPKYLIRHFIRGYFDGDGCAFINKKKNIKSFSILGTKKFLSSVRDIFNKKLCLPNDKYIYKTVNIYKLCYFKPSQIEKIFKYLYADSNVFLKRKKNKIIDIIENENLVIDTRKKKKEKEIESKKKIIKQNHIDPFKKGSVSKLIKLWSLAPGNTATVSRFLKEHYGRKINARKMHAG